MIFKFKLKYSENEQSWPQILAILTASISSVIDGILFGWPSPFLIKITEDKDTYDITESEASYFTVLSTIGICILSPILIPFTNTFGRKTVLLSTALPFSASFLIKAYATNLWLLYFSRLCCGFGEALLFASLPVYIGEISSPIIRGLWGNAFVCSAFLGYFLINVIGTFCNVQETSLIGLCFIGFFLLTFSCMPESPYFCVMKGRLEEGKSSLKRLRRMYNVDKEFDEIKAAVERQILESGTWKDLVKVKSNRKALIAGVFLRIGQQFSGVLVFATYTQFIFKKAGSKFSVTV